MDFFAAQEAAKRRTVVSVFLFALGVFLTALAVYCAAVWAFWGISHQGDLLGAPLQLGLAQPKIFFWVFGGTCLTILLASVYHIFSLGRGGVAVAQALGARILDLNSTDDNERRLLNVVEEIAIASGAPVPAVGVMDGEESINAFAAAMDPRDAVIVVTAGALKKLTRDELQAVIGHEFSHLLNGDSKMNVTLAGWVWGLFFVTVVGRFFMRGHSSAGKRRGSAGAIMLFGLLLFIIGLIGYFFGRLIQALISRQREFLADASSVQFTRNPQAMVTTLAKLKSGSQVRHPEASGMAHFFFAPASLVSQWAGPLATHPPLAARMKAIDPNYALIVENLSQETTSGAPSPDVPASEPEPQKAFDPMTLVGLIASAGVIDTTSQVKREIEGLPPELINMLAGSDGAQAILIHFLLPSENRDTAREAIKDKISEKIYARLLQLEDLSVHLMPPRRLPVVQLAVARCRVIAAPARNALAEALEVLVALDGKLSMTEAFYIEWVRHTLGLPGSYPTIDKGEALSRVLSFIYLLHSEDKSFDNAVLAQVLNGLVLPAANLRALKMVTTVSLRQALPTLRQLSFLQRRELLIAVGRVLEMDKVINDEEEEIWRLLAGLMDCPIPQRRQV